MPSADWIDGFVTGALSAIAWGAAIGAYVWNRRARRMRGE